MKTKKLIIKKCLKEKIKIISSMGMGGKVDASKVKIMKIKDTSYDPIAREIRNFIKKEKLSDKLMVVSSSEKSVITKPVGTISYMPAISGLLLTNFVINDILKKGDM
jgi:tRNA A37 threonylcarbamoyladenosine dehydratase